MFSLSISFVRFHVSRLVRVQPGASALFSASLICAVAAAGALLVQSERADEADAQLSELQAKVGSSRSSAAAPGAVALAPLDLPPFESSGLVTALNETADESGLVLEEVAYALDDNSTQPFLRYRITMSIATTYPLVRHLVEKLGERVPHLALDSIHCAREDVGIAELNCDVVMSGFFRKTKGG